MILSVFRGAAWDWEGRWQRNQRCSRLHQRRIHAAGLRRMWSTVRWKPWWVIRKNTITSYIRTSSVVLKGSSTTTTCIFFQKVDSPRRGRRSTGFKVAMTFPTKKMGKNRPASEPLAQTKVEDSNAEEEENFMDKRALNIKENKEMVLFAVFDAYYLALWTEQNSLHCHCVIVSNLIHILSDCSLQSSWQSWTKYLDSSQDRGQGPHPPR